MIRDERTPENAPQPIRQTGGLAMSLWMTGANEIDCLHVARLLGEPISNPLGYTTISEAREKLVEARLRIRDAKASLCWIAERLQETENDLSEEIYEVVSMLAAVFPPQKAIWSANVEEERYGS